jgi:hypothetical protein
MIPIIKAAMNKFRPRQTGQSAPEYATCTDFCQNLLVDLQRLYLLALLLTGNETKAELCFVESLEDAISANGVFKGWERSWSKRCLILRAIRCIFHPTASTEKQAPPSDINIERRHYPVNAVVGLTPPIQRFVFVISVLENYSEHECALLLGRTSREVREARIEALWQFSGQNPAYPALTTAAG